MVDAKIHVFFGILPICFAQDAAMPSKEAIKTNLIIVRYAMLFMATVALPEQAQQKSLSSGAADALGERRTTATLA